MHTRELLRRREALIALGAGVGAVCGIEALWRPLEAVGAACLLQRETTEGPYYLDVDLIRRDITGDRKGTPLTLDFIVLDAGTCKPIPRALVEIWHTDANGAYSGVQGNNEQWLRGGQRAGAKGRARFETIVPGWYPGRTPHIHLKVFVGGNEVHTGQVFFPSKTLKQVYAQGVYARRGQSDVSNASDGIAREAGARAIVPLERTGPTLAAGLKGTLAIGVARG
jgi:protocatechuate 3,4-dioxygenase beta subunit